MIVEEYVDLLFKSIKADLEEQKRQIKDIQKELANREAESVPKVAYSDLPYASDGMNSFALRYVTNGRKQGEGAGNGTGVPAYYDSTSDAWLRMSDDTAVAI